MSSSTHSIMETQDDLPEGSPPQAAESDATDSSELLHLDHYSEYLLRSPREVLAVLRQVATQGDLITIYFNSGKDFLLTTLLEVNDKEALFDRGSNAEMNQRALAAEKLFCITRHDKVKLQFILPGVREVEQQGRKVLAAPLPETLLRLQRREYYRLHTPITRPLMCQIPVAMTDGSVQIYEHNVIDISLGGLSLQVGDVPFEAGQEWHDCTLDLPQIGVLTLTLRILNFYDIILRNGQRSQRAGCRFVDIPASAQNLIQRYIVRIERERKARESGLG